MANLSIFSARLKNARIMKGLSMDELCSAMGNIVSKMTISKYENGLLAPNSSVIIALSKALEQPIDYFFRPFTVQVDSVRFRKKSTLPQKKENSLRETIADLMESRPPPRSNTFPKSKPTLPKKLKRQQQ